MKRTTMSKPITFSLFISLVVIFTSYAQNNKTTQSKSKTHQNHSQQGATSKATPGDFDALIMKNNKLMKLKDGKYSSVEKEMTLKNGTKITTEGTLILKDGSRIMLRGGEGVTPDGDMVVMKNNQLQNSNLTGDYIMMVDGVVWANKDGEFKPLAAIETYKNGTKVSPDGIVILKNNNSMLLRDGEIVDASGQIQEDNARTMTDRVKILNQMNMEKGKMEMMEMHEEMMGKMSSMKERGQLLEQKTSLLDEKVNLLNQAMADGKVSKSERTDIDQKMKQIDEKISTTDRRLRQLDESSAKK